MSRHYRTLKRKITQKMLENGLPIADYAKKHNYSISGIHYQITNHSVIGFKWRGRLFIVNIKDV